jgi:hypothetical protein
VNTISTPVLCAACTGGLHEGPADRGGLTQDVCPGRLSTQADLPRRHISLTSEVRPRCVEKNITHSATATNEVEQYRGVCTS